VLLEPVLFTRLERVPWTLRSRRVPRTLFSSRVPRTAGTQPKNSIRSPAEGPRSPVRRRLSARPPV